MSYSQKNTELKKQNAWMWLVDEQVYGLSIDMETQQVEWYDDIDCFCAGDNRCATQTVAELSAEWAPPAFLFVPADVLAEIQTFINSH